MKLTDQNIDCLQTILEYLKFGDFLSAASSNKRLNEAANLIFIRKHSRKIVYLKDMCISRDRLLKNELGITIYDLRTSLQFLRCFGQLVFEIEFVKKQPEFDQHVINYINEYCSESIKRIRIENGLNDWANLQKPFSKVKTVELKKCDAVDNEIFINLNRLFPKMQILLFFICNIETPLKTVELKKCDGVDNEIPNRLFSKMRNLVFSNCNNETPLSIGSYHFPNLNDLSFYGKSCEVSSTISCGDSLAPILRLNPQLTHICIRTNDAVLDSIDFQNAIKTSQKLETLTFAVKSFSSAPIDDVIHLSSVKRFGINTHWHDIIEIPFLFGQLENLKMEYSNQLNAEFFSFIEKHPTIKKLEVKVDNLSVMDQTKIAKSLPSLESIELEKCKVSVNETAQFINYFQKLTYFKFRMNERSANDDFRALLNTDDWKCYLSRFGWITVKRRTSMAKKQRTN